MSEVASPFLDREFRAAELALGLLEGDERVQAERELLRDPSFRASHAYWEALTEKWLDTVPPMRLESDLWPSINARLANGPAYSGGIANGRSLGRAPVRAWAIAATMTALLSCTIAVHFYQRDLTTRHENTSLARRLAITEGERKIGQIRDGTSNVLVTALYDPPSGTIDLRLDVPRGPSRVPELWVIPADGRPRSLGTFPDATGQLRVQPAMRTLLTDGVTLALTLEPADGALHSAPTGPVLGTTELRTI